MRNIYIDTNGNIDFIKKFPEILKSFSGKFLLISLIQENRTLEDELDVSDIIIYDSSDYISGIVDLEKSLLELDDENYLLPSSYKIKEKIFDFEKLINDLEKVEFEQLDNLFILFDNNLEIENKPKTIKVVCENLDEAENVIVMGDNNIGKKFNNIVGYINDDEKDFNEFIDNIINSKFIIKNTKKGFLEKIKGIFSKNG